MSLMRTLHIAFQRNCELHSVSYHNCNYFIFIDVNECSLDTNSCDSNADCNNTVGSYFYQCCSMLRKTEHALGRKRKYDEFPTLTRGSRGNPKVSQVYCRRLYNNLFNMISNFREDLIVSLSYDVNIIAKYS